MRLQLYHFTVPVISSVAEEKSFKWSDDRCSDGQRRNGVETKPATDLTASNVSIENNKMRMFAVQVMKDWQDMCRSSSGPLYFQENSTRVKRSEISSLRWYNISMSKHHRELWCQYVPSTELFLVWMLAVISRTWCFPVDYQEITWRNPSSSLELQCNRQTHFSSVT